MNREIIILILLSAGLVMLMIVLLVVVAIYRNLHHRTGTSEIGEIGSSDKAFNLLSPTERKFYNLFEKGLSTSEIADAMHVEISTVYTMKHRIKKKIQDDNSLLNQ